MAFSVKSIQKAQKRKSSAAPSLPPMGAYDPNLFLQYQANSRTGDQAQETFDLGQAQAQDQYGIDKSRIQQQTGNQLTDLGTSSQRAGEDHATALANLATSLQRSGEDHTTALGNLAHNYSVQATNQAQSAGRANVESGGILAQALAARQANETRDQAPIDTAYNRAQQDNATEVNNANTAYNRSVQDNQTSVGRVNQASGNALADALLGLSRNYGSGKNGQPLGSQTLNLIQTKNSALGGNLDLSGVAYNQAAANGFRFPSKKKKQVIL